MVQTHETYENCMETLEEYYGDTLQWTNRQITQFVQFVQDLPGHIGHLDKISADLAKLEGYTSALVLSLIHI